MRTLLLYLVLTSTVLAQSIVTTNETIVSGLKNVRQIGDYVLVDPESKPEVMPAASITINTEATNISVRFTDKDRRPVPFIRLNDKQYLITQVGSTWVDLIAVDFPKNILVIDQTVVIIEPIVPPEPPKPPTPPVPPTPTVPEDAFDNIGQRVAQWSKAGTINQAVGKIYLDAAKALKSNPATTITDQSQVISAALKALPEFPTYQEFANGLNADLSKRWPISKGVLADYYAAVALGLGVK
jgi:hypothetical protein